MGMDWKEIKEVFEAGSFAWPFVVGPIVLAYGLYAEARDWWRKRHR
jgi:hypothetical protein